MEYSIDQYFLPFIRPVDGSSNWAWWSCWLLAICSMWSRELSWAASSSI